MPIGCKTACVGVLLTCGDHAVLWSNHVGIHHAIGAGRVGITGTQEDCKQAQESKATDKEARVEEAKASCCGCSETNDSGL